MIFYHERMLRSIKPLCFLGDLSLQSSILSIKQERTKEWNKVHVGAVLYASKKPLIAERLI